jgi:hypothetical protein
MLTQQTSGIGATPGKTGASTVLKDAGESSRAGDKAAWEDADFVVRPATETDCEELINIFMVLFFFFSSPPLFIYFSISTPGSPIIGQCP